jgi:ubiquinol-cytochrome c reductase cytochrome b subunit
VGEPDPDLAAGRLCARINAALNRFFSLHYLLPFVIAGGHPAHLGAAHSGFVNPTGRRSEGESDTVPFHPYYTAKDGFGRGPCS